MVDHAIARSISVHDFSVLALRRSLACLQRLRERGEQKSRSFRKLQPSPLLRQLTRGEMAREVASEAKVLLEEHAGLDERAAADIGGRLGSIAEAFARAESGLEALKHFHELVELEQDLFGAEQERGDRRAHLTADDTHVHLEVRANGRVERFALQEALAEDERDRRLLSIGISESMRIREERREPSMDELILFEVCHALLDRGVSLPTAYLSLGTSGFRAHQTCLSLADPGPGHLAVTGREQDILRGTVVHVEHIDRDSVDDKEVVEAYRLPAARNAARVRFAIGDAAPVTAYVGRPVFENRSPGAGSAAEPAGTFEVDLLKSAHMTASACSVMFANGIADCKIAIERMSAAQALSFMRAVAGNVLRDRHRQRLSAAFNIHTPILDDRPGRENRVVEEPFEIARIGLELAHAGGFEKVTWDGASGEVPSRPFTEQLEHAELVTVVHQAHERGLETYISAGMKGEHMRPATHAGVGGVGIGTSLHYRDEHTGLMGALRPESIQEVLRIRDEAEREPLGLAARLLARLDHMFFEGSLPPESERLRESLFQALCAGEAARCDELRRELSAIESLQDDRDHPLIESARRRLAALRTSRRARDMDRGIDSGAPDLRTQLERAVQERDLARIEELA